MAPKLLILGGTTEASALAHAVAAQGIDAVFSYAGRVAHPKPQPIPTREGGFGGVGGLVRYLREHSISHVIDATHPFAAQMSWNAYDACQGSQAGLMRLTRPAWRSQGGDHWTTVADIDGAVQALAGAPKRVFLALGKLNVPAFAAQPQHHYVLRFVDPPNPTPPLPDHRIILARGPFEIAGDLAVMQTHMVDVVVCKNAGGEGAVAKLVAARQLGLPVVMIDRPKMPPGKAFETPEAVLAQLDAS